MKFDIHQLEGLEFDEFDEFDEQEFYQYLDELMELFLDSPEGKALAEKYPGPGFWAAQVIDYGYNYIGVTIPAMEIGHINELLKDIFPRKISLQSPDEAKLAIPELIAFWEFIKREFKLPNASIILSYLRKFDIDKFVEDMNDPANFGMAKSFFMQGQQAGFDMTDKEQFAAFATLQNMALLGSTQEPTIPAMKKMSHKKKKTFKIKQKRKQEKAARKRNRKKKRKK